MSIFSNSSFQFKLSTRFNTLLIIMLSFFYLQGNPNLALIIITIPLVVESMFIIFNKHRFKMSNSVMICFVIVVYTIIFQLLLLNNLECLSFLFTMVYYIMTHTSVSYLSREKIIKYTRILLFFGIVLLTVDTVGRYMHPLQSDSYVGSYFFYKYKGKGLLFIDTNNTGMVCLAFLGFLLYLDNIHNIKFKIVNAIYIVLLVLTFSRAAIIAYVFLFFFVNKRIKIRIKFFAFCVAFIGLINYMPTVFLDASTSQKINMFTECLSFWSSATLSDLMFGIGFTNSINVLRLFTHSWPLTFSLEFGFIGFILILSFWFFLIKESKNNAMYILVPCLLAGLSFLPLLTPYIYALVAISIVLDKKSSMGGEYSANQYCCSNL